MHRYFPWARTGRTGTKVAAALLASIVATVCLTSVPSSAENDHSDVRHRKNQLDRQVKSQRQDVDEVSTQLVRAQARVDAAVSDLSAARATLESLREQVRQATLLDHRMQARLEQAVVRLENARADLEDGQRAVVDQKADLASFAMSSYQTGGLNAMNLGLGFDSDTVQSAVNGVQGLEAVGNKQVDALQRLQAAQVLLRLTEDRVEETEADVRERRIEARENLETKRRLEAEAATAKQDVLARVEALRVERARVAAAKQRELQRLHSLEAERNRVQERLERIAERRAKQHNRTLKSPPTGGGGGGVLSYPVSNTYITSPYGMRMHPILHVYKLHDGTDFHADCGTPVYAAAAGRVSEEYYNAGYGNRVIIDHGYVNGVSLATSYNHLTSFVARVGQHVDRGQLIAYSGTTGYSTACHLHFMVYVNGATVDPMGWL